MSKGLREKHPEAAVAKETEAQRHQRHLKVGTMDGHLGYRCPPPASLSHSTETSFLFSFLPLCMSHLCTHVHTCISASVCVCGRSEVNIRDLHYSPSYFLRESLLNPVFR